MPTRRVRITRTAKSGPIDSVTLAPTGGDIPTNVMAQRQSPHTEILFGVHPVAEALIAGRRRIERLYRVSTRRMARLADIILRAEDLGIPVEDVDGPRLTKLCGTPHHQGVGARVSLLPWTGLPQLWDRPPRLGTHHFLLAFDGVTDPHNLGALLRTAVCAGADGMLLPSRNSCTPTPTVSKISAGALEHCSLTQVTNLARTLKQIKTHGFWVAGLDRAGHQSIYDSDLAVPLVLVIGSEGKGIRPLVKAQCDFLMTIPQKGPIDSLNASVAGAVAMYEVMRQCKGGGPP